MKLEQTERLRLEEFSEHRKHDVLKIFIARVLLPLLISGTGENRDYK